MRVTRYVSDKGLKLLRSNGSPDLIECGGHNYPHEITIILPDKNEDTGTLEAVQHER